MKVKQELMELQAVPISVRAIWELIKMAKEIKQLVVGITREGDIVVKRDVYKRQP